MKLLLIPLACLGLLWAEPESVDFATLSDFDYEEGVALPKKVTKLNNKEIKVSGFMKSFDGETEDITSFWLVNQNCNCEGPPKMNELILCTMPEGESVSIEDDAVEVEGTFEVGEDKEDDYVVSIYRLSVKKLR